MHNCIGKWETVTATLFFFKGGSFSLSNIGAASVPFFFSVLASSDIYELLRMWFIWCSQQPRFTCFSL